MFRYRAAGVCVLLLAGWCAPLRAADSLSVPESLSAETIIGKLQAADQCRAGALHSYTGKRVYAVDYHGFPGGRHAEMTVEAKYTSPDQKDFRIVSEDGSKLLLDRVLRRLLDSEKEALQNTTHEQNALRLENYIFTLLNVEETPQQKLYVLRVEPKAKRKFLYRGTVWIDAEDFAVARIEAEPAANPSFWISHTEINHVYTRVNGFWLPARNESVTRVRLGGKAVLTIDYTDYNVGDAVANCAHRLARASTPGAAQ